MQPLDDFSTAVYTRATESYCRADPLPSFPPKPSPPRDPPAPDYIDLRHHSVRTFVGRLINLVSLNSRYIPPSTETAFALTALAVLNDHTHILHNIFWSSIRRADTANRVQRVIESGQYLIIPAPWTSAAHALNGLAAREEARRAAVVKRKLAMAQASGSSAGMSLQKAQVHTPRVTRAAAARQTQLQQQQTNETPAVPDADATSPPRDRKRRRSPPAETPTPAPQRASARQQKQCTEAPVEEAVIPPAVVASTTACPRARSASQESNETLVASTSATSPTSSRAVSVLSADTVVGVEVASNSSKGKGRLIAPASAPPTEDIVAPVGTEVEAGMVTRSRTKRTPFEPKPPRAIPYPANKDAQLAAGRGGPSKRAPTGKRKVAKAKAN